MRALATLLLSLLFLMLFGGCQNEERGVSQAGRESFIYTQKPLSAYAKTIVENATPPKTIDLKAKKMELAAKEELERIRAEKEIQIARLQAESEKRKLLTQKELTLKKINAEKEKSADDRKMTGWIIFWSLLAFLLLLYIFVKIFREYRQHKFRVHEDRLRHERELKEKEIQTRLAEKMFDTLASGQLNEEHQKRLLDAIAGSIPKVAMKK
jgi:uncharacterized membrane protein